jgi:hypothetical protein
MCSFPHASFHSPEASRKSFVTHLVTYLAVNTGLLLLNLLTAPEVVWAIWPLLGWGVGVLSHGLHLLADGPSPPPSPARSSSADAPSWARVERRLQNLEAIVADDNLDHPLHAESASPPSQ